VFIYETTILPESVTPYESVVGNNPEDAIEMQHTVQFPDTISRAQDI
jgi:hypothetical protein